jgi:hypothetical protein
LYPTDLFLAALLLGGGPHGFLGGGFRNGFLGRLRLRPKPRELDALVVRL